MVHSSSDCGYILNVSFISGSIQSSLTMGVFLDGLSITSLIPATILLYEFLVSFSAEIVYIRKCRGFSPACFLIIGRLGSILYVTVQCLVLSWIESDSFHPSRSLVSVRVQLIFMNIVLILLELFIIANATIFSCLRVWAILGRGHRHLIWLLPFALLPVVFLMLQLSYYLYEHYNFLCPKLLFRIRRQFRLLNTGNTTIATLLVRDGSCYFAMSIISQAVIFSFPGIQSFYVITLSIWTCRMILNLQRFSVVSDTVNTAPDGSISRVRFGPIRVATNIGGPLITTVTTGTYDEDEEGDALLVVGEHQFLQNPLSIGLVTDDVACTAPV
ncbi:hypothetical protein ABKN59_010299 [Abortiporus biennis]